MIGLLILCALLFALGAYTVAKDEIVWRRQHREAAHGHEMSGILYMWIAMLIGLIGCAIKVM